MAAQPIHALCQTCTGLNLTVEKFTVNSKGIFDELLTTLQRLQEMNEPITLGTLEEIQARIGRCNLCCIIVHSLDGFVRDEIRDAVCLLRWEIDSRDLSDSTGRMGSYSTKRLRICWSNIPQQDYHSYLVLGAPTPDFDLDIDYRACLNDQNRFLGRRISQVAYRRNLIREFLQICEKDHQKSRCSRHLECDDQFVKTLKKPFFGVVDILDSRLVGLPFTEKESGLVVEPYATMSHVWGTHPDHHKTNLSNVQRRRTPGGFADVIPNLPRSVREGISLVLGLGIRYIWVDVLCIVQDSQQSWTENCAIMDQIYGNAVITVCAADGKDSDTGLLALDENHQTPQHVCQYAPGVQLILRQPAEASIAKSGWNTRAWTFQERLLSRRCLIFSGGRIHFQCKSASMSEDIFAEKAGTGWSLELVHAPLRLLSQLKDRGVWFYAYCVAVYTARELHEPFDMMEGFLGLCNLMKETLNAPLFFGLPTSHLDFALLWVATSGASLLHHTASEDLRYGQTELPSWSWCGWESSGVKYDPDMVGGCTQDMRSWLRDHTWIDWHIRDGFGTLQRVWDGKNGSKGDQSTKPKWRGYEPANDSDDDDDYDSDYDSDGNSDGSNNSDGNNEDKDAESSAPSPVHSFTEGSTASSADGLANGHASDVVEDASVAPSNSDECEHNTEPDAHHANKVKEAQKGSAAEKQKGKAVQWEDEGIDGRDNYGRPVLGTTFTRFRSRILSSEFQLTLPEYPYNVSLAENSPFAAPDDRFDQPLLQFFTWMAEFHVVRSTMTNTNEDLHPKLSRCHITDSMGNKCGSIVVDSAWLCQKESGLLQTKFKFIAISEAKSFTQAEFPDWTYYIPKERDESEWDLFFVLLVEFYEKEGLHRRVALGKIFQAAFSRSSEEWKEIILG